jgi:hypothetical protein
MSVPLHTNTLEHALKSGLSAHRHGDALNTIISETGSIPSRLKGLNFAIGAGGPARKFMLSRFGLPFVSPTAPGMWAGRRVKFRCIPLAADANIDSLDCGPSAGPRPAEKLDRSTLNQPLP